ncbi:MAG TPA: hypothetical protein VGJ77_19990 [Gaiellaceae bacterium]
MKWAAVLAVVVLAGCSSHRQPTGALTRDELTWVRAYVGWRDGFDRDTFTGGRGVARLALASCTGSFEGAVGEAPTRRVRRVERLARRACKEYERFGRLQRRYYDANDFTVGPAMSAAETHADEASTGALDRLEGLLWESRPLPRIDRASLDSRLQPRYARVANRLTSRRLEVRCWDDDDWTRVQREAAAFEDVASVDVDGFANFYTGHVNLSPEICAALDDLAYRGDRPREGDQLDRLAYAALVLAHETDHIAGVDDEALATCDGAQSIARVARLLGADRAYAQKLADAYWRDLYEQEPPDYRTPRCGPGRPLDRSPGDGVWP